ncbi:hypothetical protein FB45DRAFT_1150343, partial [Roridomyces roridus]
DHLDAALVYLPGRVSGRASSLFELHPCCDNPMTRQIARSIEEKAINWRAGCKNRPVGCLRVQVRGRLARTVVSHNLIIRGPFAVFACLSCPLDPGCRFSNRSLRVIQRIVMATSSDRFASAGWQFPLTASSAASDASMTFTSLNSLKHRVCLQNRSPFLVNTTSMSTKSSFTTLPLVASIAGPIDGRYPSPPRPKRAHSELEEDGHQLDDLRQKRLRPSAEPFCSRIPNSSFLASYHRREAHKRHRPPPPPTGPVVITIFQTVAVIRRGESETPTQRSQRLSWNTLCDKLGGESPHSPHSHSVASLVGRLEQIHVHFEQDVDVEMAEIDPDIEMEEAEPIPPPPSPVIRCPRRLAPTRTRCLAPSTLALADVRYAC